MGSNSYDSEEIKICDTNDGSLPMSKFNNLLEFNPKTDMSKPVFLLDIEFPSKLVLKDAIREYSVRNNRKVRHFKMIIEGLELYAKKVAHGCMHLWKMILELSK